LPVNWIAALLRITRDNSLEFQRTDQRVPDIELVNLSQARAFAAAVALPGRSGYPRKALLISAEMVPDQDITLLSPVATSWWGNQHFHRR